jgi:hypothetical protein
MTGIIGYGGDDEHSLLFTNYWGGQHLDNPMGSNFIAAPSSQNRQSMSPYGFGMNMFDNNSIMAPFVST